MVLAELGNKIQGAINNLQRKTIVGDDEIKDMLNEIARALLAADSPTTGSGTSNGIRAAFAGPEPGEAAARARWGRFLVPARAAAGKGLPLETIPAARGEPRRAGFPQGIAPWMGDIYPCLNHGRRDRRGTHHSYGGVDNVTAA